MTKNNNLNLIILILIILVINLFVISPKIYAYDINDFFKDLQVLNDPRMNIAQINAARMRIKLFLNRTSYDDLFYQIYILTLELNEDEIYKLLENLKSTLPEEQYNKLLKIIENNSSNNNQKNNTDSDKENSNSSINNNNNNNSDTNSSNNINNDTDTNNGVNNDNETTVNNDNTVDANKNSTNTDNEDNNISNSKNDESSSNNVENNLKDYSNINTNNEVKEEKEDSTNEKLAKKKKYSEQELKKIFKDGYEQFYKKDYAKAMQNFTISYENNYNIVSSAYYIALIYEKQNNFSKAAEYFEKTYSLSIKLYSLNFNFVSFLLKKTGISYYKLNQFNKGLTYLLKSLEYNPSDGDTYYWVGLVYYNIKDYEHSKAYWKKGSLLGNNMCIKSYNWIIEELKKQKTD